jgi:hypothetical protein
MNNLTTTLERPARTVNFAKIQPLFSSSPETTLAPPRQGLRPVTIAIRRPSPANTELVVSRPGAQVAMARLQKREIKVPKAAGIVSRIDGLAQFENQGIEDLKLPFGMPRFVNIATLKRMLNAQRSDILLKKLGARWEVCEDSTRVDLLDQSVEFRLGAIQILS